MNTLFRLITEPQSDEEFAQIQMGFQGNWNAAPAWRRAGFFAKRALAEVPIWAWGEDILWPA
jgi:hypothetical protein